MARLEGARYVVRAVTRGERRRAPAPPFITSTLQQEAGRKLGFTAKKTMTLAQQLYEGIDLGGEGPVGLITYMRTDSVQIAREAQEEARALIGKRFGREYLPETPPVYRSRGRAQEAHEAIRPSDVARDPREPRRATSPRISSPSIASSGSASWPARCRPPSTTPSPRTSRRARRVEARRGRARSPSSGPRGRRSSSRASPRSTWRAARRARRPPRTRRRAPFLRSKSARCSPCWASIPSSTSPSRRRASRRPRWSRCWRSWASAARPPTPRSSAPSSTSAATCGASAAPSSRPSSASR